MLYARKRVFFSCLQSKPIRSGENMNLGHSPGIGQPETPKLAHPVFISHSNDDKAVADAVCAALEAENISCWIAPRVPKFHFSEVIPDALSGSEPELRPLRPSGSSARRYGRRYVK